jgi:hypothetical protein
VTLKERIDALAVRVGNYLRDSVLPRLLPEGGTTGQVLAKSSNNNYEMGWVEPGAANNRAAPAFWCDFLQTGAAHNLPFVGVALATGTVQAGDVSANRQGVARIRTSSNANSGYRFQTELAMLKLKGGEWFEASFKLINITNVTLRIGFFDTNSTTADATDGVYLELFSDLVSLKNASNGVRSGGGSVGVFLNEWYRLRISLNVAGTTSTAQMWNSSGALVCNQSVSSNIPTGEVDFTGAGMVVFRSPTGVATNLIDIDYMGFGFSGLNR